MTKSFWRGLSKEAIRHPIKFVDSEWEAACVKGIRLDRNPVYIWALIGLMCPSLSIVMIGPVPSSSLAGMPEWLQIVLCGWIVIGSIIALHACALGARFYFPKASVPRAYYLGSASVPIISSALGTYGWIILGNSENLTSALSGILTPALGVGLIGQAVRFWLEARRLEKLQTILIQEAIDTDRFGIISGSEEGDEIRGLSVFVPSFGQSDDRSLYAVDKH